MKTVVARATSGCRHLQYCMGKMEFFRPMKMHKVGIIGVYGRGLHAYKAHRPEQGFEIVMGADPFEPAARNYTINGFKLFTERFPGATLVKDYKELLANKEIDTVFIMSPDYCHEEQAVAALEAGKNVYLEKPLAITLEGCDRILRTAYRTKSKIFLGHNMISSFLIRGRQNKIPPLT